MLYDVKTLQWEIGVITEASGPTANSEVRPKPSTDSTEKCFVDVVLLLYCRWPPGKMYRKLTGSLCRGSNKLQVNYCLVTQYHPLSTSKRQVPASLSNINCSGLS